jgi:nucleotidyltransferase substrate binding protein (TIGR01987 family)
MNRDIRWLQRFSNYTKALEQLREAITLAHKRSLSKLEKQGLIQCFEYTHELAWKTLKDLLETHGVSDLFGSKDATREAFRLGIISEGDTWMDMIKSRNQTSHLYDEKLVEEISNLILKTYFSEFDFLKKKLDELKQKESTTL